MSAHPHTRPRSATPGGVDSRLPWWALVLPALGFAVGWNLVYGNVLSIPAELTAICVLFSYWWPADVVSPAVWIVIFIVLVNGNFEISRISLKCRKCLGLGSA